MSTITGTNGVTAIYDPNASWKMWNINEVWEGGVITTDRKHRYVPKVKDYVIDPDMFIVYIVDSLDPSTLIPTLRQIRPNGMSFSFTESDVLFGIGSGVQDGTFIAYLDKSVTPFKLNPERRTQVAGSDVSYAKIFKQTEIGSDGDVISRMYDNSGRFISENIPMELAAFDERKNISYKVPQTCYTMHDLEDNEIVTIVFYSDTGSVVSRRQLKIMNTAFIRDVNLSKKYVSHVALSTPFMSSTDDAIVNFPLGVTVDSANFEGIVYYTDGTTTKLPIDGTKFTLIGLDQFISSIPAQPVDLVLKYALSADEVAAGPLTLDGKSVTADYQIQTVDMNNSYKVKLFGYPVWGGTTVGYTMKWFLMNLDRNIFYDVTSKVKFAENTGTFDPLKYGYLQRKSVLLNLRDVSSSFKPFIHTQLVDINLIRAPSGRLTPWTVVTEVAANRSAFGAGLYAVKNANTTLNLTSGMTNYTDWLKAVFYNTYPIRTYPTLDTIDDQNIPVPTHIELFQGANKKVISVNEWNTNIWMTSEVAVGSTLFLKFIRRVGSTDILLSVSAMLITN